MALWTRLSGVVAIAGWHLLTPAMGFANPAAASPSSITVAATPQVNAEAAALEADILAELNRLRTNPAAYADWLETQRQYYSGTVLRLPGEGGVRMIEDETLLDEAIATLRSAAPVAPLTRSLGLTQAARDHAFDLRQQGGLGYTGSDGSQPNERVARYGTLTGSVLEQLHYGNRTGAGLVLQLVLADGDAQRRSRLQVLRADLTQVGAGCAPDARSLLCVLDYAVAYEDHEPLADDLPAVPAQVAPAPDPAATPPTPSGVSTRAPSPAQTAAVPVPSPSSAPQSQAALAESADLTVDLTVAESPADSPPTVAPAPVPPPLDESSTTAAAPEPDAIAVPSTVISAPDLPLSALELAIIAETNRVRANPAAYAAELAALQPHYDGLMARYPSEGFQIETEEGWAAVAEAIADLQQRAPLPPLRPSLGLTLGARDHATDLSQHGVVGHYGTDGSEPVDRVSRYGQVHDLVGENISYSPVETAYWHVMMLIIDDGVPQRTHREAMLREDYRVTGTQCAPHLLGQVCVTTYAGGFTEVALD